MNRAIRFCWVILLFILILISSSSHDAHTENPGTLTEASSVVPEKEKHIHIGGGFFSHFDSCVGIARRRDDVLAGSVRFNLEYMTWESPFVYLPRGELQLTFCDGTELIAEMCRLDYVADPATGRLLYRLAAACDQMRIVLTGDCLCPESEARPVLEGNLFISDNPRVSLASFRISGRNEAEAERHLNRVVYLKSDFSGLR